MKLQKIREEIERLKSQLIKGACASQIAMETRCKEEAYNEVLAILDSLQEEPKFKTGDHIRPIDSSLGSPRTILEVCDGWYVTDQGTLDFEYEDNWEAVEEPAGLDKRKLMDMLENSLSKETKESWNKRLDEDEEPVSEDLEEEVHNFSLHYHGDIVTDEDGIHLCDINESKLLEIAHHFANWQRKQMIKKACEWLMLNADEYIVDGVEEHSSSMRHDFIETFKKAMES